MLFFVGVYRVISVLPSRVIGSAALQIDRSVELLGNLGPKVPDFYLFLVFIVTIPPILFQH